MHLQSSIETQPIARPRRRMPVIEHTLDGKIPIKKRDPDTKAVVFKVQDVGRKRRTSDRRPKRDRKKTMRWRIEQGRHAASDQMPQIRAPSAQHHNHTDV